LAVGFAVHPIRATYGKNPFPMNARCIQTRTEKAWPAAIVFDRHRSVIIVDRSRTYRRAIITNGLKSSHLAFEMSANVDVCASRKERGFHPHVRAESYKLVILG